MKSHFSSNLISFAFLRAHNILNYVEKIEIVWSGQKQQKMGIEKTKSD